MIKRVISLVNCSFCDLLGGSARIGANGLFTHIRQKHPEAWEAVEREAQRRARQKLRQKG